MSEIRMQYDHEKREYIVRKDQQEIARAETLDEISRLLRAYFREAEGEPQHKRQ